MNKSCAVITFCVLTATPSISAADALPALNAGEAIAIMPDGQIARATITDQKSLDELNKHAKRTIWCTMLMVGSDGRVFLIDTSPHNPMVICEDLIPTH